MKRIDLFGNCKNIEDILYHLSRYKFVMRQLNKKDKVLEIGCGTGYGTFFLSKYCNSILGIDIDKKIINLAKKRYKTNNIRFETVNLLDKYNEIMNSKNNEKYDVIVCFEVIEHMTRRDALKLMKIMKKLKKENGVVFISTPRKLPKNKKTENRRIYHIHEYTYEELKKDLNKIFSRCIILGQLDEFIGSLNKNNVWTYFCICW